MAVTATACSSPESERRASPPPATPATAAAAGDAAEDGAGGVEPPPPPPTLLAAGDVASCGSEGDEATATILDAHPDAVVAVLGDAVYDRGSPAEFARCYEPSWGRARARTRPALGNHDYGTRGATGYFGYFGEAAGEPGKGYYSYDVGAWHVVVLNSNCGAVACGAGSAQQRWLEDDLRAHPARCTLAYWHHPRFSSGVVHGSSTAVQPFWEALYAAGADLVLAGHDHAYERFAPLDPTGRIDPARGIRSFVVGTGGRSHYALGPPVTGSEAGSGRAFGVLHLTLHDGSYDWRFVPAPGSDFTDAGSGACH